MAQLHTYYTNIMTCIWIPNTQAKSQVQQYTHVILDLGRHRQANVETGAYCPARELSQISTQGQEETNTKT